MYFQFEAALKRHEESGEGGGEETGDGSRRGKGNKPSRKRVRVPWAVMRRVNWGECKRSISSTIRPLPTARLSVFANHTTLRTNPPALTLGLDDDLAAQAGCVEKGI